MAEAYRSNQDIVDRDADRLTPGVTQRMIAGREVTPAQEAAAAAARDTWRAQLAALFERFDLLVTPTLTILPPTLERADDLLEGRCTLPVNLAGVPALALPVPTGGPLPASIQLVAAWGGEDRLLAAGSVIEEAVAAM